MNNIEVSSSVRSATALDRRSVYVKAGKLEPDDSAVYAMTDFLRENPISVPPTRSIEAALSDMNRLGIHALLVTRPQSADNREQLIGLVRPIELRSAGWPNAGCRSTLSADAPVRVLARS
jgi:CBS domain-containing protein